MISEKEWKRMKEREMAGKIVEIYDSVCEKKHEGRRQKPLPKSPE